MKKIDPKHDRAIPEIDTGHNMPIPEIDAEHEMTKKQRPPKKQKVKECPYCGGRNGKHSAACR